MKRLSSVWKYGAVSEVTLGTYECFVWVLSIEENLEYGVHVMKCMGKSRGASFFVIVFYFCFYFVIALNADCSAFDLFLASSGGQVHLSSVGCHGRVPGDPLPQAGTDLQVQGLRSQGFQEDKGAFRRR